jgi:hypothetical protein
VGYRERTYNQEGVMQLYPLDSEQWTPEQWTTFRDCYGTPHLNETFTFIGDDMCNDGTGDCLWDGMSRRCACGNRRVYWCFDYNIVYPETY